MTCEFVGIGDLHLDKLDRIIPNATRLIGKSIQKVLKYARSNGVRVILFYGDIGQHYRLSYGAQIELYRILFDPVNKDLEFHVLLGNHDFAEDGTHSLQVVQELAGWQSNLKVWSATGETKIEDQLFRFVPHPDRETSKKAVNIIHHEVAGSLRDNGRRIDHGETNNHFCCAGHLHTKHRVRQTHYSGMLYQSNFGESEKKFFHHVTVDGAERQVVNVPFSPPWRLVNLEVNSRADIPEPEPRVYYKLFISDGADVDVDKVLRDNPQIVRTNFFKSREELDALISDEWEFDTEFVDQINVDEQEIVSKLLAGRDWSKDRVEKALSILSKIQKSDHGKRTVSHEAQT